VLALYCGSDNEPRVKESSKKRGDISKLAKSGESDGKDKMELCITER
jgi:hypothetical protein